MYFQDTVISASVFVSFNVSGFLPTSFKIWMIAELENKKGQCKINLIYQYYVRLARAVSHHKCAV